MKDIELLKKQRELYRAQVARRGENALSPEDSAAAYEMIDALTAAIAEAEAAPENVTKEELADIIQGKLDEFKEAAAEKTAAETEPAPAENYLHSENSLKDFAGSIREGLQGVSFRKSWGDKLRTNGVTITSGDEFGYLPDYVVGKIEDMWQHRFPWLQKVKKVNAKRYAIRYQTTGQDSTSPDVRAKGHTAGGTKTDNVFTMLAESVETQAIYAKIMIDNITIWNDDKGLVDYIIDALGTQMVYEMHRAILVGDGRLSTSPDKINSIDPIARTTSDNWVTVSQRDSSNYQLIQDLRAMVDNVDNEMGEEIILFLSKEDKTAVAEYLHATGGSYRYSTDAEIAAQLGVSEIYTTPLLGSANTYDYQAIAFMPEKYVLIGQDDYKLDTWQNYENNTTGYRLEKFAGGAPEGLKMGAVMKPE